MGTIRIHNYQGRCIFACTCYIVFGQLENSCMRLVINDSCGICFIGITIYALLQLAQIQPGDIILDPMYKELLSFTFALLSLRSNFVITMWGLHNPEVLPLMDMQTYVDCIVLWLPIPSRCGYGTVPLEVGDWLGNSVVNLADDLVDRAIESSCINSTGKLLQCTHIRWRVYMTNMKGAI